MFTLTISSPPPKTFQKCDYDDVHFYSMGSAAGRVDYVTERGGV